MRRQEQPQRERRIKGIGGCSSKSGRGNTQHSSMDDFHFTWGVRSRQKVFFFPFFFFISFSKVEMGKWGEGKTREVRVKEKGESLFIVRPNVFTPGSTAGWL